MHSYLKIARQALRQARTPERERIDTAYADLVRETMREIEQVCPPGALRWARQTYLAQTHRIDEELFERLNDLWNSHAPLADFEAALEELVSVHAEVGRLFREQEER